MASLRCYRELFSFLFSVNELGRRLKSNNLGSLGVFVIVILVLFIWVEGFLHEKSFGTCFALNKVF